jgi:hypothetical protein
MDYVILRTVHVTEQDLSFYVKEENLVYKWISRWKNMQLCLESCIKEIGHSAEYLDLRWSDGRLKNITSYILYFTKHNRDYYINKNEMQLYKQAHIFGEKYMMGREHLHDLSLNGRIILKLILKK